MSVATPLVDLDAQAVGHRTPPASAGSPALALDRQAGLVQPAREPLGVGHLDAGEQLGDPARVDGGHLARSWPRPAAVSATEKLRRSLGETVRWTSPSRSIARDERRRVAVGDHQVARELAHREPVGRAVERRHHVEARQRRAELARACAGAGRARARWSSPAAAATGAGARATRRPPSDASAPATVIVRPVTAACAGAHSQATAEATSSGVTKRPSALPASSAPARRLAVVARSRRRCCSTARSSSGVSV